MLSKLRNLFVHRPDHVIGLDIGTGTLKIAEIVFNKGAAILTSCGVAELPVNSVDDGQIVDRAAVAAVLQRLIATSGASCKDAVLAVSGRSLFVREIVMPVMTPEELREALKWDLEKYVPYSPDSCYYDFAILGQSQTAMELRVLLVIIPNERVDGLVSLVKEVGLKPVAVDIEPLALYRTLPVAENVMVIDVGAMNSQFFIYKDGSPAVNRVIPTGGKRFTDIVMNVLELEFAEAERLKQRQAGLLQRFDVNDDSAILHRQLRMLVTEFAREVRRTAEYYQIQNKGASIDSLILTGGGSKLDNFSQHLSALLNIEIAVHDPLAGIEIAASFDKQFIRSLAPQLAVAIGLSLRGGGE